MTESALVSMDCAVCGLHAGRFPEGTMYPLCSEACASEWAEYAARSVGQ